MTKRSIRLIALLLLAGCRGEEARAPAIVTEATDSVPVQREWSVRELGHVPRYFLASGWAGADTIWGLAGNTPVFVQVDGSEYRAVRRSYWDAALSSRGALAGIDERGVWVDERLVLERAGTEEGDLSGPLLWSPDGSRLLARRVREGPAIHLLVDVRSGVATPIPARADSLWLGDPFWTADGRILLTAHPSFHPERGPIGRGDLYLHDPSSGDTRRIARAPEGVFLRPLSPWGARGVLVGEGTPAARFRVYDAPSWGSRGIDLPGADRVVAHDSARAVLVTRREGSHDPIHQLSLWDGGGARPLLSVPGRDVRIAWSPDGTRLVVSAAGEEADAEGGSVQPYYRTWVVEPR